MNKIITLLTFSLLIFVSSGCDDETVDISVLPEATTIGKNTFGFVLNNWVYVGGRYRGTQFLNFTYFTDSAKIKVRSVLGTGNNEISFDINNPAEGSECTLTNVYFNDTKIPDGTVKISKFDTLLCIVSGTFNCGDRIKHGRFDVKFSQK